MRKFMSIPVAVWIAIWVVAILVTAMGGNPVSASWNPDIQLPGSFLVFLFGWLIGPFQTIMSPVVVSVLTILANAFAYYLLVRIVLFIRGKLKA